MPQSLPLRQDAPAFSYSLDLDGKTYRLTYKWNPRTPGWHLDIADAAGETLLHGLPLTTGYPLLYSLRSNKVLPPGELIVVDLDGENVQPGRDNLGTRFEVHYHSAAETAALIAGG